MFSDQSETIIKNALLMCRRAFLFCLLFSFFISVFTLASSIYSMQVLDRVLSSNSIETLIFLTIIVAAFLLFFGILTFVRSTVFTQIANWLDKELSGILFNHSIENQVGQKNLSSQNMKDLQTLKSFIASPNLAVIFDAPFALIYLIVIFFIHPINGFITLLGGLIMLKIAYINHKSTKKLIEQTSKAQAEIMQNFEIIASNSDVINAMGMKSNVRSIWLNGNAILRELNEKLANISNKISAVSKAVRMLIQTITMASSAILVIYNKMSAGGIIATSILAGKALAPFDMSINLWKSFENSKASYMRLNEALKGYSLSKDKIDLPEHKGNVVVDKLIYKPNNTDKVIIKSASFKINQGDVIGIIGPTGSGKTTLARLLVGVLKPSSGVIRLDGADIANQDLEKVGKYIGYLPQDIELFKGSVKQNIARMDVNAKDEEIIKSAEFCEVHQTILGLSQGYETIIEKNAKNLSAGQRQRIALARAYYGDVKFVVLDEPNSNLDTDGELALNSAILRAKNKKITTIVITHRTSVAAICDKIMVLQEGEVKALDKADKILKKAKKS